MGNLLMRYFTAPIELFNTLRLQVMEMKGLPNIHMTQPWEENITSLALGSHEYTPPEYSTLITYALANGASEITREEYDALQPKLNLP